MSALRLLAACAAIGLQPSWVGGQTGIALVATTVERETQAPVAYSTVTVTAIGRPDSLARFTDDVGQTLFAPLAPGSYRIRARELGFAPVDTTIVLADTATRAVVFLRMRQIPRQLATIAVRAQGACRQPGIADTAVAAQIRENAERVRLLTAAYPFYYQREERFSRERYPYRVDTATYDSRRQPGYQVGHLVRVTRDRAGNRDFVFVLPTLQDLADSGFQRVHCFWYAGVDSGALRIDVEPLISLGDADVAARFYLDPERYLVKRATFRVTHPERINPQLESQIVETRYRELAPLVAVPDSMVSTLKIRQRWRAEPQVVVEESRMIGVWDAQGLAADTSVVAAAADTAAETVREIHGRLIAADSAPLAGAHVEILSLRLVAITGDSGEFDLHGVPAGEQTLFIRRLGNRPTTVTLPAHVQRVTIRLPSSSVVTLDPVVVQAAAYQQIGFDQRRATQHGFFLDAAQIARMGAAKLHDLVGRASGFQWVPPSQVADSGLGPAIPYGSIRVEGDPSCMNATPATRNHHVGDDPSCTVCVSYIANGQLIVDGSGINPSFSLEEVETHYPPKDIAALEVYGASAAPAGIASQAPADCATIVIWTKQYLASLKPNG